MSRNALHNREGPTSEEHCFKSRPVGFKAGPVRLRPDSTDQNCLPTAPVRGTTFRDRPRPVPAVRSPAETDQDRTKLYSDRARPLQDSLQPSTTRQDWSQTNVARLHTFRPLVNTDRVRLLNEAGPLSRPNPGATYEWPPSIGGLAGRRWKGIRSFAKALSLAWAQLVATSFQAKRAPAIGRASPRNSGIRPRLGVFRGGRSAKNDGEHPTKSRPPQGLAVRENWPAADCDARGES